MKQLFGVGQVMKQLFGNFFQLALRCLQDCFLRSVRRVANFYIVIRNFTTGV